MDKATSFKEYANSFGCGYLKTWKANSIVLTLSSIPDIYQDDERFIGYLENCLTMEGFRSHDIKEIAKFLKESLELKRSLK